MGSVFGDQNEQRQLDRCPVLGDSAGVVRNRRYQLPLRASVHPALGQHLVRPAAGDHVCAAAKLAPHWAYIVGDKLNVGDFQRDSSDVRAIPDHRR